MIIDTSFVIDVMKGEERAVKKLENMISKSEPPDSYGAVPI